MIGLLLPAGEWVLIWNPISGPGQRLILDGSDGDLERYYLAELAKETLNDDWRRRNSELQRRQKAQRRRKPCRSSRS